MTLSPLSPGLAFMAPMGAPLLPSDDIEAAFGKGSTNDGRQVVWSASGEGVEAAQMGVTIVEATTAPETLLPVAEAEHVEPPPMASTMTVQEFREGVRRRCAENWCNVTCGALIFTGLITIAGIVSIAVEASE